MASFGGSISRRYARAIFEIGTQKGLYEAFATELDALAGVYAGAPDLQQALENPVFGMAQRRSLLEKLLPRVAPSREVRSFGLMLLERGRIDQLPAIARAYRELVDEKLGRVRATVTSAVPLEPGMQTAVQRALERRTGKRVVLSTSTDPSLIGGIVARVGDLVFDGSLRTRLETLKSRIQS